MHAHTPILALSALGLLVAFGSALEADDSPAAAKRLVTRSDCERLVVELVYPHKPPFTQDFVLDPPKSMDEKALAKIRAAYDTLSDNIEVSLPVLAKHVDDERFSYVYEDTGTSGAFVKAHVGWACQEIIAVHVEVYRRYLTSMVELPRYPMFILKCGGTRKWWKSRQRKTLAELQMEAIKWALRQKKPGYFQSEEEWVKGVKAVEKMAADIRTSGKPIAVEHHLDLSWLQFK